LDIFFMDFVLLLIDDEACVGKLSRELVGMCCVVFWLLKVPDSCPAHIVYGAALERRRQKPKG
jgi:hypothetical protein